MCDGVLEDILEGAGRWGKFQFYYYTCLGFAICFSVFPMSYIFTARDIKYRCHIPGCENSSEATYNPEWLVEFVPYKENLPSSCLRYAFANNTCSNRVVLKNETVKCNTFVYQRQETTIVHDFNITCEDNLWKLTIIGTVNAVGELFSLSFTGFISDKYGRKILLVSSMLSSTAVGVLMSFSTSYLMYAILEFLNTALSGGLYGAVFIIAMEMVGSKERNVANTIICCVYALGQAILGVTAWLSPSWRIMLRILYIPGIISVIFFWTVPESIRWLLSVNRKDDARNAILRIANINKKQITQQAIDKLTSSQGRDVRVEETIINASLEEFLRHRVLLLRTIVCSFAWISCVFVYYALTLHSVALSEDIYLSFILAVVIEIPAYVVYYYANEKIGRRLMMFFASILGGVSCVAVGFIPEDLFWFKLAGYLLGKCSATIAYTLLYIYTSELFPTSFRHRVFSFCSMFGRLGSITAPQIPLLARISKVLPLLVFGGLSSALAVLVLFLPETHNKKLPDTIEDAINLGRTSYAEEEESNVQHTPM